MGPTADDDEKLFGWDFVFDPGHCADYAHARFEERGFGVGLVGGESGAKMGGALAHVFTEDLAETRSEAEVRGGHVLLGPKEIPHVGFFETFVDPEGNRLAIISESPPP